MKPLIAIVGALFVVSCTTPPYEHVLEDTDTVKATPIEIPYDKKFDVGRCVPLDFSKCVYLL